MGDKLTYMNRIEFLRDTINYYSDDTNRRCIENRMCYYSPEKIGKSEISNGCAIGRHLSREDANFIDNIGVMDVKRIINDPILSQKLPEWMKDLGTSFLYDVQLLHDRSGYWNESGITAAGIDQVKKIQREYELGSVFEETILLNSENKPD